MNKSGAEPVEGEAPAEDDSHDVTLLSPEEAQKELALIEKEDAQEKEFVAKIEEAQSKLLQAEKDDVSALKKRIFDLEEELRKAKIDRMKRSVAEEGGPVSRMDLDEMKKLVDEFARELEIKAEQVVRLEDRQEKMTEEYSK